MNQSFLYSVLKYRHSHVSNEVLNVGILFIFPAQRYIEFCYPQKLNRLQHTYYDLRENDLKAYLVSFDSYAKKLLKKYKKTDFDFANYGALLDGFLVKDDSSLQFSDIYKSKVINDNLEETIKCYYNTFLNYYQAEVDTTKVKKHTESFVISNWKNILKSKIANIDSKISKGEYIKDESGVYFKPNYFWNNGTRNLVKAVSFDLNDELQISDKALLYYAKLEQLSDYANKNKVRFDLLIGEPTSHEFKPEFDKALGLLRKSKANKQIIIESQLLDYTEQVVKEAKLMS